MGKKVGDFLIGQAIEKSGVENAIQGVADLFDEFMEEERKRIEEIIANEMAKYRVGVSIKDNWCCPDMRRFAVQNWGINNPKGLDDSQSGFATSLQWHGFYVNYCPFCGAKL